MTFLAVLWVCLVGVAGGRILVNVRKLRRNTGKPSDVVVSLALWICLGALGLMRLAMSSEPYLLVLAGVAAAVSIWDVIANGRGIDDPGSRRGLTARES